MRETWYVMGDGSTGDPREVAPDEKGVLRNKAGLAVAMRGQVPSTRGVDVEEERAKALHSGKAPINDAEQAGVKPEESKDMKPEEPRRPYKTREMQNLRRGMRL